MIGLAATNWDPNNSTRKLTCGLEANDASVLHPGKPLFGTLGSDPENTLYGTPASVELKVFSPCIGGKFQLVTRVNFVQALADNYTCMGSPMCIDGIVSSRIVCYTLGKVYHSVLFESLGTRTHSLLILMTLLPVWLVYLEH